MCGIFPLIGTSKEGCVAQVRNRFETLKQKKYQAEEPDYVPDGRPPLFICSMTAHRHG